MKFHEVPEHKQREIFPRTSSIQRNKSEQGFGLFNIKIQWRDFCFQLKWHNRDWVCLLAKTTEKPGTIYKTMFSRH